MKKIRPLDWALDQKLRPPSVKLTLVVMARRGNASGFCYMSYRKIADEAGCSLSTVQRAIFHLSINGYIIDVSKNYPHRITKTYRMGIDRASSCQNEMRNNSNQPDWAGQNDRQNLNESKYKSTTRLKPSVDNVFIGLKEGRLRGAGRKKRGILIGQLVPKFD